MKQGFTLIEFIVIISIFAIMASIALFNYNGFRSNVALNNLAHDIGLTIRQAQVFGWANQSENMSGGTGVVLDPLGDALSASPVRFSDGVYFDISSPQAAKQIILYKKLDSTLLPYFIDDTQDRVIDTVQIAGPNSISGIYYAINKEDLLLDADGPAPGIQPIPNLSIAFSRPKPEALFFTGGAPIPLSVPDGGGDYVGIYIKGDADAEPSHVIIISRTGEIDVQ